MGKVREAKRYIEVNGWHKGDDGWGLTGEACVSRALQAVGCNNIGPREHHPIFSLVNEVGCKLWPERMMRAGAECNYIEIPYINDHPDTTLEDVWLWFDKAAAEAGELP